MDLMALQWWQNQRNDMSGQPLQAFPSMEPYIIRPAEFKTWVRHRYLVPTESAGLRCDCSAKPQLDRYGLHLSCGCNKGSHRTNIHDALVWELQNLLKYAGYWTKHEERDLFKGIETNNNNRPDITIYNPANLGYQLGEHQTPTKVIIDVSFSCVFDGVGNGVIRCPPTRTAAMKIAAKASARYKLKYNHYRGLINRLDRNLNQERFWILPFVIQTTGLLHNVSLDLLEKMADSASHNKKIPGVSLFTYFKRRISCCLAKNLATTINTRGYNVISHSNILRDRTFTDANIMEQLGWMQEE